MFFVLYLIIVYQIIRTGCLPSGKENANTQTHFEKDLKNDDRFFLNEDENVVKEENQNSTVQNLKSNFFDKMLSDEMLSMHKHIYDKSHETLSVSILNKNNVPTPTLELKQKWLSMDLFTKQGDSNIIDSLDSEEVATERTKQNIVKDVANNVIDFRDELIKINDVMKDKKRNMEFAAFYTNFPVSVGTHVKRRHYEQNQGVKVCSCKNTCTRKSSCCSSKKPPIECTHKPNYKPVPFTIITPLMYPYSNNFYTMSEKSHHKHKQVHVDYKWGETENNDDSQSEENYGDENKVLFEEKNERIKYDENEDRKYEDTKYEENEDSKYDENKDHHSGNNYDSGNESEDVQSDEETNTIKITENYWPLDSSSDDNQLIENILEDLKFRDQPKTCYCNSSQDVGIPDLLSMLLFINLILL